MQNIDNFNYRYFSKALLITKNAWADRSGFLNVQKSVKLVLKRLYIFPGLTDLTCNIQHRW